MEKERMKRLPVNENDLAGVEDWLEEMAAKGFFLTETAGRWWYFREKEPERLCYRLELTEENDGALSAQVKAAYEENGWDYVTSHEGLYHIFASEKGTGTLPYRDAEIRGGQMKRFEKRLRDSAMATAAAFSLILVSNMNFWQEFGKHPAQALAGPEFPLMIAELLLWVWLVIHRFRDFLVVRRQREENTGPDGRYMYGAASSQTAEQGRKRSYESWLFGVLLLLFAVCLFRSCGRGGPIEQQLENGDVFLSLQYLEDGMVETLEIDESRGTGDIIYYFSPLAKAHYTVSQKGRVKKAAEDRGYLAGLEAEYYHTYSEKMAQAILDEWLADAAAEGVMPENVLPEEVLPENVAPEKGFDAYYLAEAAEKELGLSKQKLYARRGTQAFSLTYAGKEKLLEAEDVLLEILETSAP